MEKLTVEDLMYGYSNGIFPMADAASDQIYWYSPDPRAVIPIYMYKPARSLRPIINQQRFEIKINYNFEKVIRACALPRYEGDETWISEEIIDAYIELHKQGLAHSVEAYKDNLLAGGLYGVALGSAFFGESMFFHQPNASKVALHFLIEQLKNQNFKLLDTQFLNDNVLRYGAVEISRNFYLKLLRESIQTPNTFY